MKIKILNLLLIVFPILLNAQNTEIEWGEEFKVPFKVDQASFIGVSDYHYFFNYKKKKGSELMVFDFNHQLIQTITVGENQDGKKLLPEKIIKTKAGNFLITSAYYWKEKLEFVYASQIMDDGNINFSNDRLFTYPVNKGGKIIKHAGSSIRNKDNYGFTFSPDSTKLLFTRIYSDYEAPRDKGKDKYQLYVFDQSFNEIWEKTIALPYIDERIDVNDYSISNKGNVFLIASKVVKKGRRKAWIPKYDLKVFRANREGIYAQLDISIPNCYPIVGTGFCDEDESFYIGGIYMDIQGLRDDMGANGTFMMKYDKMDQLLLSKKYPFSQETREALIPSFRKKAGDRFFSFSIDLLLIDYHNQRFSFVAENRYFSTDRGYHSDDILFPNFSFDGELNWVYHYPKKYLSPASPMSASRMFLSDNKVFLFHHCFKSKEERKKLQHKKKFIPYSYYTDLVTLGLDGELTSKETLFFSRNFKKPIFPMYCEKISDGRILLYTRKEKKIKFGTCKIN